MRSVFLLFILINFPSWGNSRALSLNYTVDFYQYSGNGDNGKEHIGILQATYLHSFNKNNSLKSSLLLNHASGSPTVRLRDAQVVSNIDTEGGEGLKLFEVFYEHTWYDLKFRIGLIDLSTFINTTASSMDLINSSFGTAADFGFAGRFGPAIYPIPSWGGAILKEADLFYFYAALMDTISENNFDPSDTVLRPRINSKHHLMVVESGITNKGLIKEIGAGVWRFKDSSGIGDPTLNGFYLHSDFRISHLEPFIRFSRSTKLDQKVYQNFALGLYYPNLFNGIFDLSLGHSQVATQASQYQEKVREVLVKKSWSFFSSSLSFQHIENLGSTEDSGHVFTLRLNFGQELAF